jgi:hypothetical protein
MGKGGRNKKRRDIVIQQTALLPGGMAGKDYIALFVGVAVAIIPLPDARSPLVFLTRWIIVGILLSLPVFHYPWVISAKTRKGRWFIAFITLIGLSGLITIAVRAEWPPIHRHTLSKAEETSFKKSLAGKHDENAIIQLACAPGDEVDCEYASNLIPLFGEAGWKVYGQVDRIMLIRPLPGIVLAAKGLGKPEDETKWDSGAWMKVTPEFTQVRQAFVNIGIEPESTSGSTIPDNQINIYVGHEREDESAPTTLTQYYLNIERAKHNQPLVLGRQ